ncbi:MAG: hypothetical protein M3680_07710 [Myxococcota bacterium]|nr:hypothetical protein [Myxococcota bacterium]
MNLDSSNRHSQLTELARSKLIKILGAEQGERVFFATLLTMQRDELTTADDLYEFAELLSAKGGIEAAVGALLGMAAVVRGASGKAALARAPAS